MKRSRADELLRRTEETMRESYKKTLFLKCKIVFKLVFGKTASKLETPAHVSTKE